MSRMTAFILALLVLFMGVGVAESPVIQEYEDEITFPGVEWLASESTVREYIQTQFPTLGKRHITETPSLSYSGSWNYSDPGHIIFPVYYETAAVNVEIVEYSNEDYYKKSVDTVAGWPISEIEARFIRLDWSTTRLFEIKYLFGLHDEEVMTYEEQYEDILHKLIAKYGQPYVYAPEEVLNANDGRAVWKGKNGTGLVLSIDWGKYISLEYGTTQVNDFFANQIEKYDAEQQKKHDDAVTTIQEDSSGL